MSDPDISLKSHDVSEATVQVDLKGGQRLLIFMTFEEGKLLVANSIDEGD